MVFLHTHANPLVRTFLSQHLRPPCKQLSRCHPPIRPKHLFAFHLILLSTLWDFIAGCGCSRSAVLSAVGKMLLTCHYSDCQSGQKGHTRRRSHSFRCFYGRVGGGRRATNLRTTARLTPRERQGMQRERAGLADWQTTTSTWR